MNTNNIRVAKRIRDAIRNFDRGSTTLDGIQSVLVAEMNLIERDGSRLYELVHRTEADLEHVRFAVHRHQQQEQAMRCLEELREVVAMRREAHE